MYSQPHLLAAPSKTPNPSPDQTLPLPREVGKRIDFGTRHGRHSCQPLNPGRKGGASLGVRGMTILRLAQAYLRNTSLELCWYEGGGLSGLEAILRAQVRTSLV
jgi:hypothetical protein